MVELRKRPAPPAAPPPAKKKATPKTKAKKEDAPAEEAPAFEVPAAEAPAAVEAPPAEVPAAKSGGSPKVGDTITLSSFGGEIQTNNEEKVNLAKLAEDSKAGVVLFTYPKASTPGCKSNLPPQDTLHYHTDDEQARPKPAFSATPTTPSPPQASASTASAATAPNPTPPSKPSRSSPIPSSATQAKHSSPRSA